MASDGLATALHLSTTLHPTIKSKLDELRALGFDLDSAEAQRYPTFSLQAQTMSNDQHQVIAVLQQPLWVGGRIDLAIDQSDVKVKIGRAALLGIQRQLLENTAATYATLQGVRQRLKAAELNVTEHEKLKQLISRREAGGIASNADVLLAASRTSQAVAQRIQLEGVLLRAENDLLALTQQPVAGREPVNKSFTALPEISMVAPAIVKASATLASFLRQYDAGRKSWVDVLNTQRELSDARLGLEQTRSSLQETTLRLGAQLGLLDSYAGVQK